MTQSQPYISSTIETRDDALEAFRRAWPSFATEGRSVFGSELHYQALLYHCLRVYGEVPSRRLGMNVKMWITDVVTDLFRKLDEKKHPDYRGGFEPITDVVIFRLDIGAASRRRNRDNTLRQALMAIEVKASEREKARLGPKEIVDDFLKLEALRTEALHKGGSDPLPAVVVVDTAPEANKRMTSYARHVVETATRERGVCLFYVSPSDESVVPPDVS